MKKFLSICALTLLSAVTLWSDAASVSGGRSIGMSRPSVARSVAPTYRPSPAAGTPRPALTTPAAPAVAPVTNHTTVIHQGGGGGGGGFGSSFLGAAAGSVVGNALMQPHAPAVVAAPAAVAVAPQAAAPAQMIDPSAQPAAPVYVTQAPQTSMLETILKGFFVGSLLLLLALAGWWVYIVIADWWDKRKYAKMQNSPLPFDAITLFLAVQKAYAARRKNDLRRLVGPNIYPILADTMPTAATTAKFAVNYSVVDRQPDCISVKFTGDDLVDNVPVNELWHIVLIDGVWKLDGIDQL